MSSTEVHEYTHTHRQCHSLRHGYVYVCVFDVNNMFVNTNICVYDYWSDLIDCKKGGNKKLKRLINGGDS